MKFFLILLVSGFSSLTFAVEDVCESLFVYEDGQIMNSVAEEKGRVLSSFTLVPGAIASGTLQKQVMDLIGEYGASSVEEAILLTDDGAIEVTIVQAKKTRKIYTMIQTFFGDTESGKVFSFYSSKALAELSDGNCYAL